MPEVILIGMGPTALSALESLQARFTVAAIVRDVSDREADPVWIRAQESDIPVHTDCSPAAIEDLVMTCRPRCVVASSYHRILDARLIAGGRFINVHYGYLPRYRGRANVNWALINDEAETAISIHVMVPGLDAGSILFQRVVPIGRRDTVADLYERLNDIQRRHLADAVARYLNGEHGIVQREDDATYGCTRLPEDGEIDWSSSTRSIDCLVRALAPPFPGARTFLKGKQLMVWRAEGVEAPLNYIGRIPGRVVRVSRSEGSVDVLTGDGILRLHEVQPEGEGRTRAAAVIRSVKDTLGLRTVDLLERIRILEQMARGGGG